jgi:hypothetical protein
VVGGYNGQVRLARSSYPLPMYPWKQRLAFYFITVADLDYDRRIAHLCSENVHQQTISLCVISVKRSQPSEDGGTHAA